MLALPCTRPPTIRSKQAVNSVQPANIQVTLTLTLTAEQSNKATDEETFSVEYERRPLSYWMKP